MKYFKILWYLRHTIQKWARLSPADSLKYVPLKKYTQILYSVQSQMLSVKAITDGKDSPQVVDVLPLTLEEIFIYEMGGEDYEVKDIIY